MTIQLSPADLAAASRIATALMWRGDQGDDLAADAIMALLEPAEQPTPAVSVRHEGNVAWLGF